MNSRKVWEGGTQQGILAFANAIDGLPKIPQTRSTHEKTCIHHDDILIVDRPLEAVHGNVVIAIVDGELTVKRLYRREGVVRLQAENPDYSDIELQEETSCEIWGVATSVVHSL